MTFLFREVWPSTRGNSFSFFHECSLSFDNKRLAGLKTGWFTFEKKRKEKVLFYLFICAAVIYFGTWSNL